MSWGCGEGEAAVGQREWAGRWDWGLMAVGGHGGVQLLESGPVNQSAVGPVEDGRWGGEAFG